MYTINLSITPLAVAVFDGIQGTLGRLNSTDTHTQTKEMATITTPVFSPVQPTKGTKLESKLDLGVIEEEDEEDEEDAFGLNALGTSELPAVTGTSTRSAKVFQSAHLSSCVVSIMGAIPEDAPTTTLHSTVPETKTDTENYTDQFRGTVPPSSLDIAIMKHRLKHAPYVSSMLNPDAVRSFTPLKSRRPARNAIFLEAVSNHTLQQAAKAEEAARARLEAARAREGAIELDDDDDEQFLLVPPDDCDDLMAEYINFDALADDIAQRQANAYTWDDMDDDDYY